MRRLIVLCVLAASGASRAETFDPAAVYHVPRGRAPADGPADAPITVVEWSDYACGYCHRVQGTLHRLDQLYPGLIRWVHRALPLDEDETLALEAALAAAAQGRFRPMHQRLFALRGRVTRAEAELVARELGLDMIRFRGDLDAGIHKRVIAEDAAEAERLGVSGTPTFFINGRPIAGSQSLRVFAEVVDQELARAEAMRATQPADLYEALIARGHASASAAPGTAGDAPFELDPGAVYRVGLGLPGHQRGPDDALVTIVKWSDFQCPYCQRQAPVLDQLRARFGDQVRVVFRHYPMSNHRDAMLAAEAAMAAAAQGKFWAFHDRVWAQFGKLARADLEAFATAAGLDLVAFRAALDDRRYHHAVVAEAAAAEALGVAGTPTLFINGQPVVGARDAASLEGIVNAHLENARRVTSRGIAARELYPLIVSMGRGDDRADPAAIPQSAQLRVEMRPEDRGRAVVAACRRRDAARAAELAASLPAPIRRRVAPTCAGEGIDLP